MFDLSAFPCHTAYHPKLITLPLIMNRDISIITINKSLEVNESILSFPPALTKGNEVVMMTGTLENVTVSRIWTPLKRAYTFLSNAVRRKYITFKQFRGEVVLPKKKK